jgi:hypothetical protein
MSCQLAYTLLEARQQLQLSMQGVETFQQAWLLASTLVCLCLFCRRARACSAAICLRVNWSARTVQVPLAYLQSSSWALLTPNHLHPACRTGSRQLSSMAVMGCGWVC